MKIYEVVNSHYNKPIGYFSSYKKALSCIEKMCNGEITCIFIPDKNGYNSLKDKWYHKKYMSDVEWASCLLDRKNLNNAKFGIYLEHTYCMNESYKIYEIIVE